MLSNPQTTAAPVTPATGHSVEQLLSALEELGYSLRRSGTYIQTAALYRNGDNNTSLAIYPDKNLVIDFVTTEKFSIEQLIARTLQMEDGSFAKWLADKNIVVPPVQGALFRQKMKLKTQRVFSNDLLLKLAPIYAYPLSRGISENTVRIFKGGLSSPTNKGKLSGRFIFPVFNDQYQVVGFVGRDVTSTKNTPRPKVKIVGDKSEFKYPLFINAEDIKTKREIILVESIFDCLALYECGIKTAFVLFGVDISTAQINCLLKLPLDRIIISVNNDALVGGQAGNKAASKLQTKLRKYFDAPKIQICLPPAKDWNELLMSDGGREKITDFFTQLAPHE
jgi:hypothetical protein